MSEDDVQSTSTVPKTRYFLYDFLVDFLGGLVPGTLFSIGIIVALVPPLYELMVVSSSFHEGTGPYSLMNLATQFFNSIKQTPNALWIAILLGASALAYFLGHLFYRQDPKGPDKRSFEKLSNHITEGKKILTDEQIEKLKCELACTDKSDCEFPYPYLDRYLGQRGLDHLTDFVLWSSEEHKDRRSKTYINLLKIRLRYHHPEKVSVIIRNEAHVRLASSSWYVARVLKLCSIVGIVLFLLSICITIYRWYYPFHIAPENVTSTLIDLSYKFFTVIGKSLPSLISPLFVLIIALYARAKIESFIHYQRLREAFYVLETAHTAFKGEEHLLDPPFKLGD